MDTARLGVSAVGGDSPGAAAKPVADISTLRAIAKVWHLMEVV
jgi:hypothetical protein